MVVFLKKHEEWIFHSSRVHCTDFEQKLGIPQTQTLARARIVPWDIMWTYNLQIDAEKKVISCWVWNDISANKNDTTKINISEKGLNLKLPKYFVAGRNFDRKHHLITYFVIYMLKNHENSTKKSKNWFNILYEIMGVHHLIFDNTMLGMVLLET